MALYICPECGGKISDRAKKCPHCGATMEKILPFLKPYEEDKKVAIQTPVVEKEIPTPKPAPTPKPPVEVRKKSKMTRWMVLGIVIPLAICAVVFGVLKGNKSYSIANNNNEQSTVNSSNTVVVDNKTITDKSWILGSWKSKEDDLGYCRVVFKGDGSQGSVQMTMYFPAEISSTPSVSNGIYSNDGNIVMITFDGESDSWSVNNSHDVLSANDGMAVLRKEMSSSNVIDSSKEKNLDYLTDYAWYDLLSEYDADCNSYLFSRDYTFCYKEYTYDDEGNEITKESKGTYTLDGNTIEVVYDNGNKYRMLFDNERLEIKGDTKVYKCWESLNSIYGIYDDELYYLTTSSDSFSEKPNTCHIIQDTNGVLGLEINQYQGKTMDDFPDNLGNPTKTIRLFAKNRKYLYDSEGSLQATIDDVSLGGSFTLKGEDNKWFLGGYGCQ